jgi:hypothetical protein
MSQPPAAAERHTVAVDANTFAGHVSLVPVQASATSQPPAAAVRQTVPVAANPFAGQSAVPPGQNSATSHPLALAARHNVPLAKELMGQVALTPVQRSSTSHPPAAAARQTVADDKFVHEPVLHVWQSPQDAALQQKPPTQLPELQSNPPLQVCPLAFLYVTVSAGRSLVAVSSAAMTILAVEGSGLALMAQPLLSAGVVYQACTSLTKPVKVQKPGAVIVRVKVAPKTLSPTL